MPKRTDIHKIMVIGSGPIIIGQAAEFDYAGSQACQALREEGYEVILINSNPATIMTDTAIADRVYIEPLTLEFAKRVIFRERPDAILGSLGGQTGLNLVVELARDGILEEFGVEVLGTDIDAINRAEDREMFRALMQELNEPVPESAIVHSIQEGLEFASRQGYPLVVRPAYTLGGTGGGFVRNEEELTSILERGLKMSPVHQCLVEQSIAGYKEIEYEVMRDAKDNAIVVCNMENVDPVGIHTGDSIVVAPVQTLTDHENQMLRNASLKIIRALGICGGCNVQLALDPESFNYYVIEVNPRVSRSSALASKATGYPIARISAKLSVGLLLSEILNPVTGTSYACFEPALDYVVTKFPRLPFDKFPSADRRLGTQMKATGEVMSIGRTFEESFLKSVRSLEIKVDHLEQPELKALTEEELYLKIKNRDDERIFAVAEWLRRGYSFERVWKRTNIDPFFLHHIQRIIDMENEVRLVGTALREGPATPTAVDSGDAEPSCRHAGGDAPETREEAGTAAKMAQVLREAKAMGFSDSWIGRQWDRTAREVYELRRSLKILPVYKMVDTCAGEFRSETPYYYSTYETENESQVTGQRKVIVLGSGPIRIGQGVEFDYCTVHCIQTLHDEGYEAIIINNNPETVSTDFSISDKLYFEPLTTEDVMHVIDLEQPLGVVVQFGGQTAINLAASLSEMGVRILGTSLEGIDKAEDRQEFESMLKQLKIPQPEGDTAFTVEEALVIARRIGYPVLVRPSYVLGGRAMEIVHNDEDLKVYMQTAVKEISHDSPILVDRYVRGRELEIDAVCDGNEVYIPGVMEHVERAGIHSGDSLSVYPTQAISDKAKNTIIDYAVRIGRGFQFIGLYNIQFIVDHEDKVYVLEVNPRSSRTVPFLSKITHIPMCRIATKALLGESLRQQGIIPGYAPEPDNRVYVKAPVFSFAKLRSVDTVLGPEMKSTGEALGGDVSLEKALYKALVASGVRIPLYGNVLFTIADDDKEDALEIARRFYAIGYGIYATAGTARFLEEHGLFVHESAKISEDDTNNVLDIIRDGKVSFVINTMDNSDRSVSLDGFLMRRISAENNISCMTSLDTAEALLRVLESMSFSMRSMGI